MDAGDKDKKEGLQDRYAVERLGDEDGRHSDCWFFVLDPEHDPLARYALREYANIARKFEYWTLADDIDARLNQIVVGDITFKEIANNA